MKRDLSFYMILIMCLFVTCYLTSYILANRTIELGGLIATAAAFVYPLTYFLAVVFYERYGKNKVFELINFAIVSLIFMGLMIAFAGTFKVYGGSDGLESIFNIDFRVLFACVIGFMTGQFINIKLYDFLGGKKGFDFLIAGVIAITIDSFLFVFLAYTGVLPIKEVLVLATGQYVLSVLAIIIYAICFNSLSPSLLEAKKREEHPKKVSVKKETKEIKKETKKEEK